MSSADAREYICNSFLIDMKNLKDYAEKHKLNKLTAYTHRSHIINFLVAFCDYTLPDAKKITFESIEQFQSVDEGKKHTFLSKKWLIRIEYDKKHRDASMRLSNIKSRNFYHINIEMLIED